MPARPCLFIIVRAGKASCLHARLSSNVRPHTKIMSHFDDPTHLVCLECGCINARAADEAVACRECDAVIEPSRILQLYEYAAEVYYYGRQYRLYYERAYAESKQPPKPSLAFAGEAFAWLMLAVLSGVAGNASYDAIKAVVRKIKDGVADGRLPARDPSRLLELNDDELGELVDAARVYCDGMEGLTREVRAAIVEEVIADAVAHSPLLADEMTKLMQRKVVKPKHRKKFAELLRLAVVQSRQRSKPPTSALAGLWSRLGE